jgi:hypothetical protein
MTSPISFNAAQPAVAFGRGRNRPKSEQPKTEPTSLTAGDVADVLSQQGLRTDGKKYDGGKQTGWFGFVSRGRDAKNARRGPTIKLPADPKATLTAKTLSALQKATERYGFQLPADTAPNGLAVQA